MEVVRKLNIKNAQRRAFILDNRGVVSRIAREFGVTASHVTLILKGEHVGRKDLQNHILAEYEAWKHKLPKPSSDPEVAS